MSAAHTLAVRSALAALVVCAASAAAHAQAESPRAWTQDRERGWFWNEAAALQEATHKTGPAAPQMPAPARKRPEVVEFERLQHDLAEAQQVALMNPTAVNVNSLLELRAKMFRLVSTFTDAAQMVAWRSPTLDVTFDGVRPTNEAAMHTFDMTRMDARDATLRTLASDYGLFFVFRGDCPYCHTLAPFLRQFQQTYGFTVFPITMDDGALPEYPDAHRDNGMVGHMAGALQIPLDQFQVPFVALARPRTGEVIPIGFGVMSADEMADRVQQAVEFSRRNPATSEPLPNAGLDALRDEAGRASDLAAGLLSGALPGPLPGAQLSKAFP